MQRYNPRRLKEAMVAAGYSCRRLADELTTTGCRCSTEAIRNWSDPRVHRSPTVDRLLAIAAVLQCSIDTFMVDYSQQIEAFRAFLRPRSGATDPATSETYQLFLTNEPTLTELIRVTHDADPSRDPEDIARVACSAFLDVTQEMRDGRINEAKFAERLRSAILERFRVAQHAAIVEKAA